MANEFIEVLVIGFSFDFAKQRLKRLLDVANQAQVETAARAPPQRFSPRRSTWMMVAFSG